MAFTKAERKRVKLKILLTGPSGGGKSFSALALAEGLGGKVAVIDTENDSASLYSDKFNFDVQCIRPPFTTERYEAAIKEAIDAGYGVLVIDSITHAWKGEGGILDQKTKLDARGGNSFTNWKTLTPKHERFISAILQSDIHIICTARSKQDYILEANDKGKQMPKKVGLASETREGTEYEFTTVFDIAMDHNAQTSKDRTGLFGDNIFQINKDTGELLLNWINAGKTVEKQPESKPVENLSALKDDIESLIRLMWDDEIRPKAESAYQNAGDDLTKLTAIHSRLLEINGQKE